MEGGEWLGNPQHNLNHFKKRVYNFVRKRLLLQKKEEKVGNEGPVEQEGSRNPHKAGKRKKGGKKIAASKIAAFQP